jgi:hypothetical protein
MPKLRQIYSLQAKKDLQISFNKYQTYRDPAHIARKITGIIKRQNENIQSPNL